jgi:hypothetical protein
MTDERYIDISEDLLHDLEEHDRRGQPGDEIIQDRAIASRIRQETPRFESDLKSAKQSAARERTRVVVTEAAKAATALIKASGLPPDDEPAFEPEPEQPIPEPDPEEPLPVPPNLDPGIVAVASRKPTAQVDPRAVAEVADTTVLDREPESLSSQGSTERLGIPHRTRYSRPDVSPHGDR